MAPRTSNQKFRPQRVYQIKEVFSENVKTPIYYEIITLSTRGTRYRIMNWGDGVPRVAISSFTPRGWRQIFSFRITTKGLERAEEIAKNVLKIIEALRKMASENLITIYEDSYETSQTQEEIANENEKYFQ